MPKLKEIGIGVENVNARDYVGQAHLRRGAARAERSLADFDYSAFLLTAVAEVTGRRGRRSSRCWRRPWRGWRISPSSRCSPITA